ncbi:MAG: hypothetical protein OFPII_18370 [Osedax symbiont Rs1]|nr:MAG: hypothetical protein OFPII_18370 [Osedax symbiont Rs1]
MRARKSINKKEPLGSFSFDSLFRLFILSIYSSGMQEEFKVPRFFHAAQ